VPPAHPQAIASKVGKRETAVSGLFDQTVLATCHKLVGVEGSIVVRV
jgi:hypothetical protein